MSLEEYENDAKKLECLQQENIMLKKQLRSAGAMIALGELLGTTTHEFNNILMTIINYAALGLRHDDTATRVNALQKIDAAGRRAAKITENILAMAKNRKPRPESTDLVRLTDDVLLLLEREMRKYRVSIDRNYDENVSEILACGNQIQQVLLNLLINARQAMGNGGNVLVKIANNCENNTVELSVRDNGSGISPEVLPHIFEPFYSTKKGPDESGKGGTGLGLSMCREIIEEHNGKIIVQSTVGKGTRFTLIFPAIRRSENE